MYCPTWEKLFSKVTDSMTDAVERAYWTQNNPLRLASVRELNYFPNQWSGEIFRALPPVSVFIENIQ